MTNIASRLRHAGANNFPLQYDIDMQVSFVVVASIAARYAIPLPMRKLKMECKVISDGKLYELTTLARGSTQEADEVNWTEKVFSDYILTSSKGAANGVVPLNADGLIDPQYLANIFVSTTYVVADRTARLQLNNTVVGDFAVQEDDGTTWLKLTNTAPSGDSDWAQITAGSNVVSVNGETGAVTIDFTTLLNYGNSNSQFQTAVSNSTFANSISSSVSTLEGMVNDLPNQYYLQSAVDAFLLNKADKTLQLPTDGSRTNYNPTLPYQPATKKYVDDQLAALGGSTTVSIGELYVVDNAGGTPQQIATTYQKITQWNTLGTVIGTSASLGTSSITTTYSGYYTITATISLAALSPATAPTVTLAIFINGVESSLKAQQLMQNQEAENFTINGTIFLTAGKVVDLRLKTNQIIANNILVTQGTLMARSVVSGSSSPVLDNLEGTTIPTVNDDSTLGYSKGSTWIWVSQGIIYTCVDETAGAAVWKVITSSSYVHDQGSSGGPSTTWSITHNLNRFPTIVTVDTAKRVINGQIDYLDANNITVTFNNSTSGYAYMT